ncbi:MAG: hypothetical protein ACLQBD_23990, partial [Syntrophobacteraceae bacterium]
EPRGRSTKKAVSPLAIPVLRLLFLRVFASSREKYWRYSFAGWTENIVFYPFPYLFSRDMRP